MYGILTYSWLIFGVNVGTYSSTMEHLGLMEETQTLPRFQELAPCRLDLPLLTGPHGEPAAPGHGFG